MSRLSKKPKQERLEQLAAGLPAPEAALELDRRRVERETNIVLDRIGSDVSVWFSDDDDLHTIANSGNVVT